MPKYLDPGNSFGITHGRNVFGLFAHIHGSLPDISYCPIYHQTPFLLPIQIEHN
jgi:hypothetical protein